MKKKKAKRIQKKKTQPKAPQKKSTKGAALADTAVLKYEDDIFFRDTADDEISILNANVYDSYYKLNAWAARLWKLLDGKKKLNQIVLQIVKESALEKDYTMEEAKKVAGSLIKAGLVKVVR